MKEFGGSKNSPKVVYKDEFFKINLSKNKLMSDSESCNKSTQSTDCIPTIEKSWKGKKSIEECHKIASAMKKSKEDKLKYTQVCMFWMKNLWRKGENWEFLHSFDPSKIPIWKKFLKGLWMNPNWIFTHNNNPSNVKKWKYYENGFWINGRNWQGYHEEKVLCPDYQEGFCPLGPKCNKFHLKLLISPQDDWFQRLVAQMFAKKRSTKPLPDKIWHNWGERGHTSNSWSNSKIPHQELIKILQNDHEYIEKSKTVVCNRCWEVGHYPIMCPRPYGANPLNKLPDRNIDILNNNKAKKRELKGEYKAFQFIDDNKELLKIEKHFPILKWNQE